MPNSMVSVWGAGWVRRLPNRRLYCFPNWALRAAGDTHLPWRDSAWLVRLFTELTFSHLLELSRIDELSRRAFYE
jgi:hypothetical protein